MRFNRYLFLKHLEIVCERHDRAPRALKRHVVVPLSIAEPCPVAVKCHARHHYKLKPAYFSLIAGPRLRLPYFVGPGTELVNRAHSKELKPPGMVPYHHRVRDLLAVLERGLQKLVGKDLV